MEINRLKGIVKKSLKDGHFSLSTLELESNAINEIADDFLPDTTIRLDLDLNRPDHVEEPPDGNSIIVRGQGVDLPFRGLQTEVRFYNVGE